MDNLKFLLLFGLITMLSCQKELQIEEDFSQQIETRRTSICSQDICVLTWNTFLIDAISGLSIGPDCEGLGCEFRANYICQFINSLETVPDVVALQEVFHAEVCDVLIECMISNGFIFNSGCNESTGLITFSKFPIQSVSKSFLQLFGENPCTGFDCLKNKGLVLSEIQMDECACSFHLLNTHLNAGTERTDINDPFDLYHFHADARERQMELIRQYIDANVYPKCQTILFAGDFNFDVTTSDIENFETLEATPLYEVANITPSPTNSAGDQILDYILIDNTDIGNVSNVSYVTLDGNLISETNCWWELPHSWYLENDLEDIELTDPYIWFDYQEIPTEFLDIVFERCIQLSNVSDHKPVMSCMTIRCDEECEDVAIGDPCDPPCEVGYECIDGECLVDILGDTNDCNPPCPPGERCFDGECEPI